MKSPSPRKIAYCWLYFRELTRRDIERHKCRDPEKQSENNTKVCKWLQTYGEKEAKLL